MYVTIVKIISSNRYNSTITKYTKKQTNIKFIIGSTRINK